MAAKREPDAWECNDHPIIGGSPVKKNIVAESKEVKTGWSERQVWQNFVSRWLKKGCFASDNDDDDDDE
jgi:hypothetical protein